jgi:hypothetical protein
LRRARTLYYELRAKCAADAAEKTFMVLLKRTSSQNA